MPHLAPLSWALASFLFWFLLLMFVTSIWWSQSPKFSLSSKMTPPSFSSWNWS
uniref:ATP synthase F0 subunit 8 n=1 Tax=Nephtys sp. 'San Juan Island' YV-2008 TaxID=505245 RepID=B2C6R3_9ANNE|nr:ATP synthase F0 subunit 8 [Nephtys sp. 'San Juan Island' YV-2008]